MTAGWSTFSFKILPCPVRRTQLIILLLHQPHYGSLVEVGSHAMHLPMGHNIQQMRWWSVPCRSSLHVSGHHRWHITVHQQMLLQGLHDPLSWVELYSICSENMKNWILVLYNETSVRYLGYVSDEVYIRKCKTVKQDYNLLKLYWEKLQPDMPYTRTSTRNIWWTWSPL